MPRIIYIWLSSLVLFFLLAPALGEQRWCHSIQKQAGLEEELVTLLEEFGYSNPELKESGGESAIFLVRRGAREIAVKVPHRVSQRTVAAYQREFALGDKFGERSPVVRPDRFRMLGDVPILEMEYFARGSLRNYLAELATFPGESTVLEKMLGVGKALRALHAVGYSHGDMKPANILFDASGHGFVFVDTSYASPFGEYPIGSVKGDGPPSIMGTPGYVSPGKIAGRPADPRDDLFAVGKIYLEFLFPEGSPTWNVQPAQGDESSAWFPAARSPCFYWSDRVKLSESREVLSALAYFPWESVQQFVEAHEVAERAIREGSEVFWEYYRQSLWSPTVENRPQVARYLLDRSPELSKRGFSLRLR